MRGERVGRYGLTIGLAFAGGCTLVPHIDRDGARNGTDAAPETDAIIARPDAPRGDAIDAAADVVADASVLVDVLQPLCERVPLPDDAGSITCGTSATASEISAGDWHTCALIDGEVRCWGTNRRSQFGYPTCGTDRDPHPQPVAVPTATRMMHVSAGGQHTCGVSTAGQSIFCWGENLYGQVGAPMGDPVVVPAQVNLPNASKVYAGVHHTCAIDSHESAFCWGNNDDFRLGYTGSMTELPVLVRDGTSAPLAGVQEIFPGHSSTCARIFAATNPVRCWGGNDRGQLGSGSTAASSATPQVVGVGDVQEISLREKHVCALVQADGAVWCWGDNTSHQLGPVAGALSNVPVYAGISGVSHIAVGLGHTCAVQRDAVLCWGDNTNSQLGAAAIGMPSSSTPLQVSGLPTGHQIAALVAGWNHTCALLEGGADAGVYCWGWNYFGQLGDGTTVDRAVPVRVCF